jgi:hypothetical protein
MNFLFVVFEKCQTSLLYRRKEGTILNYSSYANFIMDEDTLKGKNLHVGRSFNFDAPPNNFRVATLEESLDFIKTHNLKAKNLDVRVGAYYVDRHQRVTKIHGSKNYYTGAVIDGSPYYFIGDYGTYTKKGKWAVGMTFSEDLVFEINPHNISTISEKEIMENNKPKKRFVANIRTPGVICCVDENDILCKYSSEEFSSHKPLFGQKADWNIWKVVDITPEAYFTITGRKEKSKEKSKEDEMEDIRNNLKNLFGCQSGNLMPTLTHFEEILKDLKKNDYSGDMVQVIIRVFESIPTTSRKIHPSEVSKISENILKLYGLY